MSYTLDGTEYDSLQEIWDAGYDAGYGDGESEGYDAGYQDGEERCSDCE